MIECTIQRKEDRLLADGWVTFLGEWRDDGKKEEA
jgi:hypothetical protein